MIFSLEAIRNDADHVCILYGLLKSRVYTISHNDIPSLEEHSNFVRHHPYRAWFFVKALDEVVGTAYLTDQNTIGLNILDEFIQDSIPYVIEKIESEVEPLPEIKSVRAAQFSINVAPNNINLIKALEKYGCKCSQISFILK
jgi:hypothetical protein